jgi:hypothetical protein
MGSPSLESISIFQRILLGGSESDVRAALVMLDGFASTADDVCFMRWCEVLKRSCMRDRCFSEPVMLDVMALLARVAGARSSSRCQQWLHRLGAVLSLRWALTSDASRSSIFRLPPLPALMECPAVRSEHATMQGMDAFERGDRATAIRMQLLALEGPVDPFWRWCGESSILLRRLEEVAPLPESVLAAFERHAARLNVVDYSELRRELGV